MKRLVAVLLVMAMLVTAAPAVFAATESGNWMIAAEATQEWTAPASGVVALSSEGGNSVAALDAEGNYLAMGANPSFEATEGVTYTIKHFGTGFDVIYWELTVAESGDVGGEVATSGTVEVEAYGNAEWTAPQDGYVKFTINISGATLSLVNGYTPVAEGTDSITAQVTGGTTYLVAPGFDVTENSVVSWEYVEAPEEEPTEAVETVPNGGALTLGDNNVTLTYATMASQAHSWTYTATEAGSLTVTVTSVNGETNLSMAFGRGVYTLLVGETDGAYTNTATVSVAAGETVNIAVLDTMDMTEVPAVLNVAFTAGESGEETEKNPADYFETDADGNYIIGSLEGPVDIFVGNEDIYYIYTAEADGVVSVTATVDGYTATNCAIKVNDGDWAYNATSAAVVAGDVVSINIWSGYEGTVTLGDGSEGGEGGETGGEGGSETEKNPADYFEKDENGYYVIGSLESPVDIFVGNEDITYIYTAESAGTVTVTPTVADEMTATNCWIQVNTGAWDTSAAPATVAAGDVVYINIWSGYEGTVTLSAGEAGGEDTEKVPADYFEQDENGNYVIPSLENNVEIFVGNDDINYIYTAEVDDTLYVTATVDAMTATNCWIKVNDGEFVTYTEPVAVTAGDVVIINIWSGYEGIVSLGEAAEVPDDGGDDVGEGVPSGSALALGDNNVTLTYATMPAMAPYWTYTATEAGSLTVTVTSINGDSNLGMAFGRGVYTLLVGETDGAYTNTATVSLTAGETVNIAVLDTMDMTEVPAVINLVFTAGAGGEEEPEKDPADYFETNDMDQFILGSLAGGVEIFSGNGDVYFAYTAEADGAVHLTATVDGYAATNCAVSVNGGSFVWGADAYAVNVSAGDSVIINVWGGFEGVAVLGDAVEDGGDEPGDEPGEETGKNPADYFDTDENGNYIIGSLESPVDIFVGNDDINYIYTAETDGTLSINCTANSEENEYVATQCWIIVNGDNTYSSAPVQVAEGDTVIINIWGSYEGTVALSPMAINAQPVDYEFIVGQDATFTVDAANVAKYVWYFRKTETDEWAIASSWSGYKTATLTVPVKDESYAGWQFYCKLTDEAGNSVETDMVTLIAKAANITITQYGANDPVVEGKVATYVITAEGAVRYQWMYSTDGIKWTTIGANETNGATSNRLNVKAWNSGAGTLYRCKMWDADGAFVYSDSFEMKVAENPLVGEALPSEVWAVKGANASMTFNVSGATIAKYQWQTSRDGVNWGNTTLPTYNQATFTLAAYGSRDNVYFRCIAIAEDGNKITSGVTQLKIEAVPFEISLQPVDATTAVGTAAAFQTAVSGFEGELSYTWFYQLPGQDTWAAVGSNYGGQTHTLTWPGQARFNGYRFRCQIKDAAGHYLYTDKVTLTVQ